MKLSESRLAIAAILLPVLYLLIVFLPSIFFFLFVSVVILTAQYEFYRFYFQQNRSVIFLGLILGFFLLSWFYFRPSLPFEMMTSLLLITILIFQLFFFRQIQQALLDSAVLLMGVFYLSGFLGHLILIRMGVEGSGFILFLLFVVWGGDAGAYYVGRAIGGKKLYPAVSPNKTVSGALGGILASWVGGTVSRIFFIADDFPLGWGETLILSGLLGGIGQLVDLVESLLKRSAGVKDSGGAMMAHGGIFDKLDGVAFAAPVLYYYLFFFKG